MAQLLTLTAEPAGKEIVELLERKLEEAKAGQLSSVAIASVHRDGAVSGDWSAPPSFGLLLGSVTRLGHRLNCVND